MIEVRNMRIIRGGVTMEVRSKQRIDVHPYGQLRWLFRTALRIERWLSYSGLCFPLGRCHLSASSLFAALSNSVFLSRLLIKHKQKVTCDKHVRGLGVTQDPMTGPLAKQAFSKQPRDFECRDIEMRRMKDG